MRGVQRSRCSAKLCYALQSLILCLLWFIVAVDYYDRSSIYETTMSSVLLRGLGDIVRRQCCSHFAGCCLQCTLSNKSALQTHENAQ